MRAITVCRYSALVSLQIDSCVCCAATDELTDVQLEYMSSPELDLAVEDVPKGWPQPKEPLYPFSGGLTDYCRLVAPGVLVGVGWKTAQPGKDVGRRFLHFMLVKV